MKETKPEMRNKLRRDDGEEWVLGYIAGLYKRIDKLEVELKTAQNKCITMQPNARLGQYVRKYFDNVGWGNGL